MKCPECGSGIVRVVDGKLDYHTRPDNLATCTAVGKPVRGEEPKQAEPAAPAPEPAAPVSPPAAPVKKPARKPRAKK